MKQKAFSVAIGICVAILIIGIVLICVSMVCGNNTSVTHESGKRKKMIKDDNQYDATLIFGIITTIIGTLGTILSYILKTLRKQEKTTAEQTINLID